MPRTPESNRSVSSSQRPGWAALRWSAAALGIVLGWGLMDPFGLRQELDWIVEDQFLQHRPAPDVHPDLLQISLDDYAAEQVGKTDLRHRLARAVRQLERLGARTVLIDFLFLEEGSPNSFYQEESAYDGLPPLETVQPSALLRALYLEDHLLKDALTELSNVVIPYYQLDGELQRYSARDRETLQRMAEIFAENSIPAADVLSRQLDRDADLVFRLYEPALELAASRLAEQPHRVAEVLSGPQTSLTAYVRSAQDHRQVLKKLEGSDTFSLQQRDLLVEAAELKMPPSSFTEQASLGFADFSPDDDGNYRCMPLVARWNGRAIVHQSLAAVAAHLGVELTSLRLEDNGVRIDDEHLVPVDSAGRLRINWPMNDEKSWDEAIPQLSLAALLKLARYDADLHRMRHNLRLNVAVLDAQLDTGYDAIDSCEAWLNDVLVKYANGQIDAAQQTEKWLDQERIPQLLDLPQVRKVLRAAQKQAGTPSEDLDNVSAAAINIEKLRAEIPRLEAEREQVIEQLRTVIEGKLCIVGDTTTAGTDLKLTPVGPAMPGVSINLAAINTMLTGRPLQRVGVVTSVLVTLFVTGMLFVACFRAPALISFGCAIGGLLAVFFGCYLLLWRFEMLASPVLPMSGMLGSFATLTIRRWWQETREKRLTREAFKHYLHPAVVDRISQNPALLKLGGEDVELSILFSDIRGFSAFSEQMTARQLGEFLNEYLTPMTEIVFDHNGLVDKYIGDAIMAFWGAPLPVENHALSACLSALQMAKRVDQLGPQWTERGLPLIRMGIGINTAVASVGNFGSDARFDYTALGDGVNLASRLEGATKQYGVPILISESTRQKAGDQIATREVGFIQVKGKLEPTRIYELVGEVPLAAEKQELFARFAAGVCAYRDRNWAEAIVHFERFLETVPEDRPSRIYVERCRRCIQTPPPEDWNGVSVMTTK